MNDIDIEDLGELRMAALAALGLFPRVEVDPQQVIDLVDAAASLRASRAREAEMAAERNRVIKALDEMRAINAMLCHWYEDGYALLVKAGIPDDEESPLADLADDMRAHLSSNDGYDFKSVRIFKGMEARAEAAEAKLEERITGLAVEQIRLENALQAQWLATRVAVVERDKALMRADVLREGLRAAAMVHGEPPWLTAPMKIALKMDASGIIETRMAERERALTAARMLRESLADMRNQAGPYSRAAEDADRVLATTAWLDEVAT